MLAVQCEFESPCAIFRAAHCYNPRAHGRGLHVALCYKCVSLLVDLIMASWSCPLRTTISKKLVTTHWWPKSGVGNAMELLQRHIKKVRGRFLSSKKWDFIF